MHPERTAAQTSHFAEARQKRHANCTPLEPHSATMAASSSSTLFSSNILSQRRPPTRTTRNRSALDDAQLCNQQLQEQLKLCQHELDNAYTHSAQLEREKNGLSAQLYLAQTTTQQLSDSLRATERKLHHKRTDYRALYRTQLRLQAKTRTLEASLEALELCAEAAAGESQDLYGQVSLE